MDFKRSGGKALIHQKPFQYTMYVEMAFYFNISQTIPVPSFQTMIKD